MRLWRRLRAALRPLPRPGVVLVEDFGRPGDTSGLPDLCDCDAWGTEKEHRPETWTHSSDFRPDFAVRHPPCPRWRPKPQTDSGRVAMGFTAKEFADALCSFGRAANAAGRKMFSAVAGEEEAAMLSRMGPATEEDRAAFRTSGMALSRPEVATVVRPPLPPYDPSLRTVIPK